MELGQFGVDRRHFRAARTGLAIGAGQGGITREDTQ